MSRELSPASEIILCDTEPAVLVILTKGPVKTSIVGVGKAFVSPKRICILSIDTVIFGLSPVLGVVLFEDSGISTFHKGQIMVPSDWQTNP